MKEKKKEELKDWSVDFDKVVSNNINTFIEKYLPKSYVYYPAKNIYMLVKKYDDNRTTERFLYPVHVRIFVEYLS